MYEPILHCTESFKPDDIKSLFLYIAYEHNSGLQLPSMTHSRCIKFMISIVQYL